MIYDRQSRGEKRRMHRQTETGGSRGTGHLVRDRQTDRQRQGERETGRQTETDRQTDRDRQRETDRQAGRQADRQTDRGRQTDRQRVISWISRSCQLHSVGHLRNKSHSQNSGTS